MRPEDLGRTGGVRCMQIELTVMLAVISAALGVAGYAAGRLSSAKASGLSEGRILAKLEHIEKALDHQGNTSDRALETAAEALQCAKSAHYRIDMIE